MMNDDLWRLAPPTLHAACTVLLGLGTACTPPLEQTHERTLQEVQRQLAPLEPRAEREPIEVDLDGSLESYLAYAFAHSPELRTSFEKWRAVSYQPEQRRELPELQLTYTGFVRSVETRVGPQEHKLSAMQWFPWPTRLTAAARAASWQTRAAQHEFEAHALEIGADVASSYWTVWKVRQMQDVEAEQVDLLEGLSEQIRVRLEVGGADLSDVSQIDLLVARGRDRVAGLEEAERAASVNLVRSIGAPAGTATPVRAEPPPMLPPAEDEATLIAAAAEHPRIDAWQAKAEAAEHRARAAKARRAPSFGVGVDWIVVGDSSSPMPPPDSGKDAVAITAGLKIPVSYGAYRAAAREARADGAASKASAIAARNALVARTEVALSEVRDDLRRGSLYRTTLVPQAETSFESVLGSYAVGRASIADVISAQRQLLEIRTSLLEAQAEYGADWAALESVVGRSVPTQEVRR